MLASSLIIALCATEEEVNKFVHADGSSLVKYMEHFCLGYRHMCGTPRIDGTYLMVDTELNGLVPDLLFENTTRVKGRAHTSRFFGYLIEDVEEPMFK